MLCASLTALLLPPCPCAATPKERQRHSKKCKELVTTLAERAEQYNVLVQEYNSGLQPALATTVSQTGGVEQYNAAVQQYNEGLDPAAQRARSATSLEAVRAQQFGWVDEYSGRCDA